MRPATQHTLILSYVLITTTWTFPFPASEHTQIYAWGIRVSVYRCPQITINDFHWIQERESKRSKFITLRDYLYYEKSKQPVWHVQKGKTEIHNENLIHFTLPKHSAADMQIIQKWKFSEPSTKAHWGIVPYPNSIHPTCVYREMNVHRAEPNWFVFYCRHRNTSLLNVAEYAGGWIVFRIRSGCGMSFFSTITSGTIRFSYTTLGTTRFSYTTRGGCGTWVSTMVGGGGGGGACCCGI